MNSMTCPPRSACLGSFAAPLRSPTNGEPLRRYTSWTLTDGERRWPVVEGIPYLRVDRDELSQTVVRALDCGDYEDALVLLLSDRKDGSLPASTHDSLRTMVRSARTLRQGVARLRYGSLGPYLIHRVSEPSYLSGLALLGAHAPCGGTLFELGCGIGQFLRAWTQHGGLAIGGDIVFANLWLARQYVASKASLVCFDAAAPFPLVDDVATVALCQDTFHYLREKAHAVNELGRVTSGGTILVGHCHNAARPNISAGKPLSVAAYDELLPGATAYDDAALTRAALGSSPAKPAAVRELAQVPAIAIATSAALSRAAPLSLPPPGTPLHVNPLLDPVAGTPRWPSRQFVREFVEEWPYLRDLRYPGHEAVAAAAQGRLGHDSAVDALARSRVLVDIPECW
jgi:SAM-dependent methyltransferase